MANASAILAYFNPSITSHYAYRGARILLAGLLLSIAPLISISRVDANLTEPPHGPVAMAPSAAQPATQVSFQTVEKGIYSGVKEPLQITIREQAEWKSLWQRHTSIKGNPPPAPAIDFGDQIVVAVFLGEKPTGGYQISFISAERINGVLTVSFSEKEPPPGAITTQAFTQPFHIVRFAIPGTEKVVFRRLP